MNWPERPVDSPSAVTPTSWTAFGRCNAPQQATAPYGEQSRQESRQDLPGGWFSGVSPLPGGVPTLRNELLTRYRSKQNNTWGFLFCATNMSTRILVTACNIESPTLLNLNGEVAIKAPSKGAGACGGHCGALA